MTSLEGLIVIDKDSDLAVYLQIANCIVHGIRSGRLRRGSRLAGSREVAALLSVHRKTMIAAYEELQAQGWIEMIPRKGTFVMCDLPDIKPKKILAGEALVRYPDKTAFAVVDANTFPYTSTTPHHGNSLVLNDGFPDVRLAPTDLFLREYRSIARRQAFRKYHEYGSAQGPDLLLDTLSSFLSDTRALPITRSNLMITKGAQMGIYLAAHVLLKPGDHVVVGEPSYFAATRTFMHAGAKINRVAVDDYGIDVDAIEALCRKKTIRLVYVIPHHHHPTTVTLIPERRLRLLELATRYRFAIIEDDYDYDFHYTSNPVLPMASLDQQGNVIYIGTLTKALAPAMRVGFMVAPENFIHSVARLRRLMDWQGDSMGEVAIAELYRNGTIGRHIKKVVKLYHARRDHFCKLMAEQLGDYVSFKIPDGGMSVWTTFQGIALPTVSEQAARKGLVMSDGRIYNTHTIDYNAARLGFASLNLKELERAVEILRSVLK